MTKKNSSSGGEKKSQRQEKSQSKKLIDMTKEDLKEIILEVIKEVGCPIYIPVEKIEKWDQTPIVVYYGIGLDDSVFKPPMWTVSNTVDYDLATTNTANESTIVIYTPKEKR